MHRQPHQLPGLKNVLLARGRARNRVDSLRDLVNLLQLARVIGAATESTSLQPGGKGDLELAFYRCYSPRPVTLAELAAVAGARWGVEDCFAEAKGEAGLGNYQVRRYRAWYRHVTLAMLAHAFLAVTAHAAPPRHHRNRRNPSLPAETLKEGPLKRRPERCGKFFARRTYSPPAFITAETGRDLIPLTAAEARRLFNLHTRTARPAAFHEQWSGLRRRRQAAARKSPYARRLRYHEALL